MFFPALGPSHMQAPLPGVLFFSLLGGMPSHLTDLSSVDPSSCALVHAYYSLLVHPVYNLRALGAATVI